MVELQRNQQENKARIEMLEFQIAEIEAAALEVEEDVRLEQERQRLLNHKMIADTLTNAYTMLDAEEFSSLANVRSAMNDLESIEEYDPTYKELSSQLSETFYALEDITKRLEDVVDGLEFDGNRLMQVESRLDLIHSITRKYGCLLYTSRDTNSIEVFVDGKTLSMTFYETTENPVYTLTADEGVNWVVKTYQK